ncbi:putative thiol:disulfide interchange protein [uncultured Stenotrophomonas sp.]|uniref:Putative thiol:disulfide interchange protein n=1 Tax=uncultured Stenotrophomonas sp. TaxID=165438 RepID=A0A1Y5Q2B5_9GAMM|nr:putative thiol:disulfide interchange protein [uncultured Stenotrophomonas sp.]
MISAGPFPLMALIAALAALVGGAFARALVPAASGLRGRAGAVVLDALLLGVLGARVVHVVLHAPDYLAESLSIIRLGDGGYLPWAGVTVALAYALWATRRQLPRKPVLLGLFASGALWLVAAMAVFALQRSTIVLPADVVLADVHGNVVPLSAHAGKPLVLNLWASWCGPCRREMPALVQAQRAHPQIGFVFANQGEAAADVVAYLAETRLQADNVLLDADSVLMQRTGARALPTTLFFGGDGRLRGVHMGELSRAGLQARLRELE